MVFLRRLCYQHCLLAALAVFLMAGALSHGAETSETIQLGRFKAAFTLHFLRYCKWPDIEGDSVIMAVPESRSFRKIFAVIEGKTIGKRPLKILYFKPGKDIPPCHALFVPEKYQKNFRVWKDSLGVRPVLTITDIAGLSQKGVMIELVPAKDRMTFAVNTDNVSPTALRLSSRLLKLAKIVKNDNQPKNTGGTP